MHGNAFRTKLRARIAGLLGLLPGIFFLIVTQTPFGKGIALQCGYWMILLFALGVVWFAYAVFIKRIMYDFRVAFENAPNLVAQRKYQIGYYSTLFEAGIATLIILASAVGFLLVDLRCFVAKFVESNPLVQ